jgi:hypothetical protein
MWQTKTMPKKSNKKKTPKDINKLATHIVALTTDNTKQTKGKP